MREQKSSRQTLHYLRAWRIERLLTLKQLAARSGVSITTINTLERLQAQANLLTVAKLARGLGISREALLTQNPEGQAAEESGVDVPAA